MKPPDPFFEMFSFLLAVTLAIAVLIAAKGGYQIQDDAPGENASVLTPY